jgi:predicted ATPase/DNA-binding winged helix-turn-helix (wHTH) protein
MDDSPVLKFGRFELLAGARLLLQDGAPVVVGSRAFDLLVALAQRHDRLVPKNELLDLVWPDVVVEENNLQVQISTLRKLLGPQAIATVPGRGYRFTAELARIETPLAVVRHQIPSPANQAPATPTNLPGEHAPLYGREDELIALHTLITSCKLVTVVGAGGIGKSRLAQAAAHAHASDFPDGTWLIELAGLFDPTQLPSVVGQALAVKLPGERAALDELVLGLSQRTLLLVLDNCEHLLEAAAGLAQAIVQGAPGVVLLATSQEPLHLSAEQQFRVVPLAIPTESKLHRAREFGAVALFEARVRAVDPRFALKDEGLEIAIDICRRLDGLPLAIELAAARVPTLGLRAVRDKLDARFRLLTGGARATLRRHQTLRAALEWSYSLLTVAEQTVFQRLGVFAGGFTMELAQGVAADARLDDWAVLDHLSALVDKSLVMAEAGHTPRYRLLESARAYALEQLAHGEMEVTLRRHALAVRGFLEAVDGPNLDGEMTTDQLRALLLPEWDNLRCAHAWASGEGGDTEVAVVIAASASSLEDFAFWSADLLVPLQGPVQDGAVSPAVAARYWRAVASLNMTMSRRVTRSLQLEASQRARSLYQELGLPRRVYSCLIQVASHRIALHDLGAAQGAADEARNLIRPDWPAMLRIRLLRIDGLIALDNGRIEQALALHQQVLRASISTGDWLLEVMALGDLTELLWQVGPIEEAARQASAITQRARDRPLTAVDMVGLFAMSMGILSEMGRIDEASAVAVEALPVMRRAQWYYLEGWAYLFWRRSQIDAATLLLGASDARYARRGVQPQPNEKRFIAELRSSLQSQLNPQALESGLTAGAALDDRELLDLICDALPVPLHS